MNAGGKEVILPKPLDPVEYVPEGSPPEILNEWANGAMLVAVRHNNPLHCEDASGCSGKITLPILRGQSGNRMRYCESCGEEVLVLGVAAIRFEALTHRRNLQIERNNGRVL